MSGIHDLLGQLYWPYPLVFFPAPYALGFWVAYFWTQWAERGIKEPAAPSGRATEDRGSLALIVWLSRTTRGLAFLLAVLTPPMFAGRHGLAIYAAGLVLMFSGSLVRRSCMRVLRSNFTSAVTVPSEINDRGMYGYVRHPAYTGGMIFIVGFGLALTNWYSLAVLFAGALAMFYYRVKVEEELLAQTFGQAFADYARRTKKFIPFVY